MRLASSRGRSWRGLHGIAELLKSANEAHGGFLDIRAIEEGGAQFTSFVAIAQHVPDRGEHGGGDGDDGFLGAASGADTMELRLPVTVFHAHGTPGGLHEGSLEPVTAAAQSRTAPFAGASVVARAQAGPGQQMGGGLEARHVDADFGDDNMRGDVAHARHRTHELSGLAKGLEAGTDLLFDRGNGAVQRVDVLEKQLEHEAVMPGDMAAQRVERFGAAGLAAQADQVDQSFGIGVSLDDALRDRACALGASFIRRGSRDARWSN